MSIHHVYEDLREQVGRVSKRDVPPISGRDLARFSLAVKDGHVSDASEPEALIKNCASEPNDLSPLFLTSVMCWNIGPPEGALAPDGTAAEQFAGLCTAGLRVMGAGQEIESLSSISAGLSLLEETTVQDVQLKTGKSGEMIMIKLRRVFRQAGEDVLRCVETFVAR